MLRISGIRRLSFWRSSRQVRVLLPCLDTRTGVDDELISVDVFQDISLNQWLALTPPELVQSHLGFDDATIAKLTRVKQEVV